MHKKVLSTLILFIGFTALQAQSTQVLDNLPPSIKWYQLKTPHFNIIYPEGFTEQGQRMANTMEHIYGPAAASLGVKPQKNFPLILQNQNSISNGFVTVRTVVHLVRRNTHCAAAPEPGVAAAILRAGPAN